MKGFVLGGEEQACFRLLKIKEDEHMKDLSPEAKEAKREYFRNWRKNNREKIKEYDRRHYEKKAQEMKAEAEKTKEEQAQ